MLIQVVRWLKNIPIILVGDGGFACAELAWRCLKLKISLITRLKINACLYDFPPLEEPGFEEVREHLGVETQRQWSDKAIRIGKSSAFLILSSN
jgi:hypothetical protein